VPGARRDRRELDGNASRQKNRSAFNSAKTSIDLRICSGVSFSNFFTFPSPFPVQEL
jgi:hypothetical protein